MTYVNSCDIHCRLRITLYNQEPDHSICIHKNTNVGKRAKIDSGIHSPNFYTYKYYNNNNKLHFFAYISRHQQTPANKTQYTSVCITLKMVFIYQTARLLLAPFIHCFPGSARSFSVYRRAFNCVRSHFMACRYFFFGMAKKDQELGVVYQTLNICRWFFLVKSRSL